MNSKIKIESLKYPIGKFEKPTIISKEQIKTWIKDLELFPERLNALLKDLTTEQLSWVYRPNGWMIKQVVHHCADSHMNSIIRFKFCLTEDTPTIKPYNESDWAKLPDSLTDDLSDTLSIIKGVHAKLVALLITLNSDDLKRTFIHPDHDKPISLEENIGIYAWHSNHHLAHIKLALKYKGDFTLV